MVLKNLSVISIIIVLAYSQVGYYFVMRHYQSQQKNAIKHKMLSRLKDDELEAISFTDNQHKIYWEEEGKEFLFNDEIYDVVKQEIINGKVILYCINDKKEKDLIDNYNLITKHNSGTDSEAQDIGDAIDLFVTDIIHTGHFDFLDGESQFAALDNSLLEIFYPIISPPPKVRLLV